MLILQDIRSLRQEIEILKGLKHEHIIEMSDAFETKSEFCVVTEFAQGELFEASQADSVARSLHRVPLLHYASGVPPCVKVIKLAPIRCSRMTKISRRRRSRRVQTRLRKRRGTARSCRSCDAHGSLVTGRADEPGSCISVVRCVCRGHRRLPGSL